MPTHCHILASATYSLVSPVCASFLLKLAQGSFWLISVISQCADILDFRPYHYPPTPLCPSKPSPEAGSESAPRHTGCTQKILLGWGRQEHKPRLGCRMKAGKALTSHTMRNWKLQRNGESSHFQYGSQSPNQTQEMGGRLGVFNSFLFLTLLPGEEPPAPAPTRSRTLDAVGHHAVVPFVQVGGTHGDH